MGRKIRRILLLIIAVAVIYAGCSSVIYAEEISETLAGSGGKTGEEKNEEESEEEKNGEEEPEEGENDEEKTEEGENGEEESEEGENGEEEPEKGAGDEEEPPLAKEYSLVYPKPDGRNGYYVNLPEIRIVHEDTCNTTIYSLQNAGSVTAEGRLSAENPEALLTGERFREGLNILNLHMEDGNGTVIEGHEREVKFEIDTKKPEFKMKTPKGFHTWYSNAAILFVDATDTDSGSPTASVSCYCGDELIGMTQESKAEFLVQSASERGEGTDITVVVQDKAGNESKKTKKIFIDNIAPKVRIDGIDDYMITGRSVQAVFRILEDNVLKEGTAEVWWEDVDGNVKKLLPGDWKKQFGMSEVPVELSEEGIYHLSISASDGAGHSDKKEKQIIIDSQSPVIRQIDGLDGKYMKRFSWDYPEEVVIRDFTSCNCQIQLDGALYSPGKEITAEGQHLLRVQATDAAGNMAEAKARFVIDHTAPEIIFYDIENAKIYEDERRFKIAVGNLEDEILEILINGVPQVLKKGNKAYQFTVREKKDYEVSVKACDKAGNQRRSDIMFELVEKETVLQKVIKPVKKILTGEKMDKKEVQKVKKNKGTEKSFPWAVAVLIAVLVSAAGFLAVKKLKKREDAG